MVRALALAKDQRRIVQELRKTGGLSRSLLATRLEISNAAVTKLSRELLALGVIEEVDGPEARQRGRPSIPIRIAPGGGYAIGATAHKGVLDIVLVDFAGGTIATHHENVPPIDPREFAKRVRRITHRLADRHQLLGQRMLGIGVAVPGPALSNKGDRWSIVDQLPGWRGADLPRIMGDELGWPLWIENDANAAALAEHYLGGLMDKVSTLAVILLGYGIGAGVIVDGRLMRGEYGVAGEIGCLFPIDQPRPSPLDLLSLLQAAGCRVSSVADIDPEAPAQVPTIEAWMDRAAHQLELVCNTVFAWLDPGAIVLAGPLPAKILRGLGERLGRAALVSTVNERRPPVRVSGLVGSPITLGAALLPIHSFAG
ncbi:ROK family transcriptional regulator [Sphingomonas sp. AP4-R1]|uniref:ROK family transcriptional regulator n=1 Tax=Sphingomonas sp. AP4-R1 TaxID=2735134 RepID=UPI0014938110|nr:ROK family transcriptional regulator [Sphingomonas sp. AP4-R1]QJU58774.1 ROK family transcriptional regulator [Sphingomonas sp. AP4-R1]